MSKLYLRVAFNAKTGEVDCIPVSEAEAAALGWIPPHIINQEPKLDDKGNYIVYLPGRGTPVKLTPEDYALYQQAKAAKKAAGGAV